MSETFVRAARDAGTSIDHLLADGTTLPFPDAAFDAATAFMSVMDMPDPAATIAEVARVVRPGGWLQFSITHPVSSVPRRRWIDDEDGDRSMRTLPNPSPTTGPPHAHPEVADTRIVPYCLIIRART